MFLIILQVPNVLTAQMQYCVKFIGQSL